MKHSWQRIWRREDKAVSLQPNGFSYAPFKLNEDETYFSGLTDKPCLILLGEPGLGKSTAIQDALDLLANENVHHLDLGTIGTEDRLIRVLFDCPKFQNWLQGEDVLHLFLDSLDECLLRLDYVAELIGEELERRLKAFPTALERLRFRVFCRTAVWPRLFERRLREIWKDDDNEPSVSRQQVLVYELMPLSRYDAQIAAQDRELDAEAFLEEVRLKQVESLAAKPVTLTLLLNSFDQHKSLPATEAEIYAQGCLLLCERLDKAQGRRAGIRPNPLEPEQRLAIAARLAALSVFCNADSFSLSSQLGESVIALENARGGTETALGTNGLASKFEVRDLGVRETLETGLFSSRGPDRMGWAHRTYAESLAASYLAKRQLNSRQIIQLFSHQLDPERKVVPQLHEVAARFASLDGEASRQFFQHLKENEPELLLRTDITKFSEADKLSLAKFLLEQTAANTLPHLPYGRLHLLRCPPLEPLLREWIEDEIKSDVAREAAIEMADECKFTSLSRQCVQIALDGTRSFLLRHQALHFLLHLGSPDEKRRLLPLTADDENDTLQQVKGIALRVMWPQALTATELISLLTPPKEDGADYSHFISSYLVDGLQVADLPIVLDWLRTQDHEFGSWYALEQLHNQVVELSLRNLGSLPVLESLALLAAQRIQAGFSLSQNFYNWGSPRARTGIDELLVTDAEIRRNLLKATIPHLTFLQQVQWRRTFLGALVTTDDFHWVLEQIREVSGGQDREAWLQTLTCAVTENTLIEVLELCNFHPLLAVIYEDYLPVDIHSGRATELRKRYVRTLPHPVSQAPTTRLKPSQQKRVADLLDTFESGDLSAWWKMACVDLMIQDGSSHYDDLPSITASPGWKGADETTKSRLLDAAVRYAQEGTSTPDQWPSKLAFNWRPAYAGFKALRLTSSLAPQQLLQLSAAAWRRWVPVLVSVVGVHLSTGKIEMGDLLTLAHRHVPDEVCVWVEKKIEDANTADRHAYFHLADELEALWDEQLASLLFRKAQDPSIRGSVLRGLLELLLKHEVAGARELAVAVVQKHHTSDEEEEAHASCAIAGHLLLLNNTNSWSHVWTLIQENPSWGREFMEHLAHIESRQTRLHSQLTPVEIAEFYLWLAREYPHDEDPVFHGMHDVTTREEIGRFRESLSSYLSQLGSFEAYVQLQRLCQIFPDNFALRQQRYQGAEQARRRTWVTLSPSELLRLCSNTNLRYVASEAELMEVVLETLALMDNELQGNLPLAPFLWNEWDAPKPQGKRGPSPKLYRPKDENDFSSFVARFLFDHLQKTGIIINREVEIRPGEFTDIIVDATIKKQDGISLKKVSVIVEAKGSWHPHLKSAMKDQLVDRYLKQHQCLHGIYLVGWFECSKWNSGDNANGRVSTFASSIEEAQDLLDQQARTLSNHELTVRAVLLNASLR